ncbi:MAG: radical SAM protein [Thiothrix sp.]|nr:MAG: radical SAM protein [Thiothrix sp.]
MLNSSPKRINPLLQFVVKVSKYCNLRCAYCYEYNELAHKAVIALPAMQQFFQNIRSYAEAHCSKIDFIWHGGEPLLVKLDYYRELAALQTQILGKQLHFQNGVQSNLTVLTERHLQFLKDKEFFQTIGVSFDVYGDQRIDIKGKLKTQAVLMHMQALQAHGIRFGAITVLAQNTYPHLQAIYQFYDSIGVSFRCLPIYRGISEAQIDQHSLSQEEILKSLLLLFTCWSQSPTATPVEPLNRWIDYALSYLASKPVHTDLYDKRWDEQTFMVNTDGQVWGTSETYDPVYCYGNIFSQSMEEILASAGRKRAIQASRQRVENFCTNCSYRGHCDGKFMGEATPIQIEQTRQSGCLVRKALDAIIPSLAQAQVA